MRDYREAPRGLVLGHFFRAHSYRVLPGLKKGNNARGWSPERLPASGVYFELEESGTDGMRTSEQILGQSHLGLL